MKLYGNVNATSSELFIFKGIFTVASFCVWEDQGDSEQKWNNVFIQTLRCC